MELLYRPEIPPLGIHPKELKAESQRNSCTLMFIAAKQWKQLKCT